MLERITKTCVVLIFISITGICHGQLPWELVTQKYEQGLLLHDTMDDSKGYSIIYDLEIDCPNTHKTDQSQCKVALEKWSGKQWDSITLDHVSYENKKIMLHGTKFEAGFYKLVIGNDISNTTHFFLVDPNWKNGLLKYSESIKREIETCPQAHHINASIVTSHFKNLQEKAAQSKYLSVSLISRLSGALTSKQQFVQGQTPDFAKGFNKLRFKRFAGDEFADFVLNVPDDYDSSRKWPLHIRVNVGGTSAMTNWFTHSGMLDLWWSSVSHQDMRWKDYVYFSELLRKKINVDNSRIYLKGGCGDGMAVMALAFHHPDEWTQCFFSTSNSFRNLAGNAYNLPIIYRNGHASESELVAYFNFAIKCLIYNDCQFVEQFSGGGSAESNWVKKSNGMQLGKKISPEIIRYTVDGLQSSKAYWATIMGREDENYVATIETSVEGQQITLKRNNVDAYQFDLKLAPLDHTRPVTIFDNGKNFTIDPQEVFTYRSSKYDQAAYMKNSKLHGPICDVFTDAYTVLYTKGSDEKETKKIAAIARQIAGTGPCVSENKLSDKMIQNNNLVVIGKADKSQFLSKFSGSFPVKIDKGRIAFDGQEVTGDVGLMMIYPNPKNPNKYVSLILGGSSRAIKKIPEIWKNDLKTAKVDVAIYKITPNDKYEFIRFEKFNTVWDWHDNWSQTLATVSKKHPKWRWNQWINHVVRTQLSADIMISEEPFKGLGVSGYERITLRDFNRTLHNQWILKIKLKGDQLKTLITRCMTVKGVPENKKVNLIMDGVSLIKGNVGSDSMHVSQIKKDQYYTVALPQKLVNGNRIGLILKDYEIVGDGYLVQLLQHYLKNRKNLELDSELKKMKLIIM